LERNDLMDATDLSRLLDAAKSGASQPTLKPEHADVTRHPPSTDEVIELFKRFRHELDTLPPGAFSGPTAPRSKVLDELSFSELFRLTALWHDVERPHIADGSDADARHAQRRERPWQGFYNWMQHYIQERWAQQYGLVEAGGDVSWKRLLGKTNTRTYWNADVDYPPCCDHTTLWRMPIKSGGNPHLAEALVTQPYGYKLDEMAAFAGEKGLRFWISEQPAWHSPRRVHFIEWAAPGGVFAKKRDNKAMHDLFRTLEVYTPGSC
jgi:hypothetical protein